MSETWHYEQNQQSKGPITLEELQQLYRSGQINARDRVWTERLRTWMPAGQVPELGGAGHARYPATPTIPATPIQQGVGTLSYSQPQIEQLMFTARSMDLLAQTRPWVRLVSIVLWLSAGLMVLVGIFGTIALVAGSFATRSMGPQAMVLPVYLVVAILYIFPALYLSRYAKRIFELQRMRRADVLEATLEAQKSFWKFVGIAIVVVICFYILLVVALLIGTLA